jgi:sulfite dehydrogenase (cytochrome) subunit B
MKLRLAVLFFSLVAVAAPAVSDPIAYRLPPETAALKPGPGADTAILCEACHSADYISTQPSRKGKAFWEAEVQKMIKVYKAPINPTDAAAIADYLAATY